MNEATQEGLDCETSYWYKGTSFRPCFTLLMALAETEYLGLPETGSPSMGPRRIHSLNIKIKLLRCVQRSDILYITRCKNGTRHQETQLPLAAFSMLRGGLGVDLRYSKRSG